MRDTNVIRLLIPACLVLLFTSCQKQFGNDNFTAYFGGEVSNPTTPYILFCKGAKVIDTIRLKKDNTFMMKFDSLTPGLYSFKSEPEYQYIYFDKNDSLMVRINANDFDESIVFCGRGEDKNNFMMELYLKNERERKKIYDVFEYDYPNFKKNIDSAQASKRKFYEAKKEEIKWDDNFDAYAKAMLDYNYFSKKEIYPVVHEMRTGIAVKEDLPKDYYSHRKSIDYNDAKLTDFSPYVRYLTCMLNNMALSKELPNVSEADQSLEMNVRKLHIADSLFRNQSIKNAILNNIAFTYLLEDQNIVNNKKFLDKYHALSTDKSKHNEILKIGNAIQKLKEGNELPEVGLLDRNDHSVDFPSLITRKTVLFFWTESLESHVIAAHKKIIELRKRHPDYNFIAINVDRDQEKWKKNLNNYKFDGIQEYRASDFEQIKDKWVINKIHRTMLLNADGTIDNAFVSLFDLKFEDNLK
ncbi:MAG: hypothetical protein CFE23_02685 [Flavobacterium sp. BFFFF1]|uniref:TlpA family protein disulfide reductase n=1 Tax=unclassified Flavobacterium TaxID=196869 RepID=UPI000BCA1C00|nr:MULTISPECIES: thioredoxin-like domain-containing protein [unclassified Flavobacterium]OYU81806.1 MAG: hypothetical protein CFE23_02685 [Flavobacterium sp. BFFFF1]